MMARGIVTAGIALAIELTDQQSDDLDRASIKSATAAVTIRVPIIVDEAPDQPAIGRANPSAMTLPPSQVPRWQHTCQKPV